MTLHFTQIFLTDARTFIFVLPFSAQQTEARHFNMLFVAVNNSSAIQVVGTQLHGHAVAGQNADKVLAHPPRYMGQHFVVILELDLEHGIGQRLYDRCHYLNRVFLRQTVSRFWCFRTFNSLDRGYSVRILAPVAVTATVCSK